MTARRVGAALRRLDLAAVERAALRGQAEAMAALVREAAPGAAVGVVEVPGGVAVGLAAPGALHREFGRPGQAPRPVLGPLGAAQGETVARRVAAAMAEAIRGR